jgi:hypothetical protein
MSKRQNLAEFSPMQPMVLANLTRVKRPTKMNFWSALEGRLAVD